MGNSLARPHAASYAVWICPLIRLGAMVLGARGSCVSGLVQTAESQLGEPEPMRRDGRSVLFPAL
jgi:hypothetical protein